MVLEAVGAYICLYIEYIIQYIIWNIYICKYMIYNVYDIKISNI